MQRFKNIALLLTDVDNDGAVVERAIALATQNQAEMTVYAALDTESGRPAADLTLDPVGNVVEWVDGLKRQRLQDVTAPYQGRGIPVSGQLLTGKPFVTLIQEVQRKGHDLVMLPAESKSSATSLFFGGTPMHLLRKCPCAVWVFRRQAGGPFHRIMAAVNVATDRREEIDLNVKIMELATSLADRDQAELHIISCWTAFAESMLVNLGNLSGEDLERYRLQSMVRHRRMLHTLMEAFPVDAQRLRIHLPNGEAGDLIPEAVENENVDLVVMGTVARCGIPGFFIGNTAEKILNRLPCSVLAVKPDGFVSPVKLTS